MIRRLESLLSHPWLLLHRAGVRLKQLRGHLRLAEVHDASHEGLLERSNGRRWLRYASLLQRRLKRTCRRLLLWWCLRLDTSRQGRRRLVVEGQAFVKVRVGEQRGGPVLVRETYRGASSGWCTREPAALFSFLIRRCSLSGCLWLGHRCLIAGLFSRQGSKMSSSED